MAAVVVAARLGAAVVAGRDADVGCEGFSVLVDRVDSLGLFPGPITPWLEDELTLVVTDAGAARACRVAGASMETENRVLGPIE